MGKQALITGVSGQDGAYLAKFLVSKGYEVTGIIRRSSHAGVAEHRLSWIGVRDQIRLVDGDLLDLSSPCRIIAESQPDEVYKLGAQSFETTSWQQPLQQDVADDCVVATGTTTSVSDTSRIAFGHVGIDSYLVIDPALYRPAEVDVLLGNPAKAKATLGRAPKIDLNTMIVEMVEADLARLRHGAPQGNPA